MQQVREFTAFELFTTLNHFGRKMKLGFGLTITTLKRILRTVCPKPKAWVKITIQFKHKRFDVPRHVIDPVLIEMRNWAIENVDEVVVFKDDNDGSSSSSLFMNSARDSYTIWFRSEESATAFALRWTQ